jgi:outer membrane protein assembly factor BamA
MAARGPGLPHRIDSIVVENGPIFNTDSSRYNYWLFRLANKLHFRTKKGVIARESLLKKGDFYSEALAQETERNLRARPYIWDAKVMLMPSDSGHFLKITTSDRWTLSGGPYIGRTGNQTTIGLGFEEQNFLGYGQYLEINRYFRNFDKDYTEFSFLEPRFFNSRNQLSFYYNNDPELGVKTIGFSRPLYSLSTKAGFMINYSDIQRREDYYRSGNLIARDWVDGKQFDLTGLLQLGTYYSKILPSFSYSYHEIKVGDKLGTGIRFPNDSIYHAFTLQLGLSHIRYIKVTHINGFERPEDISIVNGAQIGLGKYFSGGNMDKIYDILSFSYNYSLQRGNWLIFAGFARKYWYKGSIDYRIRSDLSIKQYYQTDSWLTTMLYSYYGTDFQPGTESFMYLDENRGVRGYPRYYDNGERLFRGNLENRIFPGISIMSADLGVVQFFDLGRVWKKGETIRMDNLIWSVGFGLRLGMEKLTNAEIIRVDIAYAGLLKKWEISFGLGQYIK